MGEVHCAYPDGPPCCCDGIDLPDGTAVCIHDERAPRCELCGELNPTHYKATALAPEVWMCEGGCANPPRTQP